jgi:formylglycine-generating enzyme required for sulfatase activity
VGTAILGAGLWSQLDLAGNEYEWTLESDAPYVDPCVNCAVLIPGSDRISLGGACDGRAPDLLASNRSGRGNAPTFRDNGIGFRCARTP